MSISYPWKISVLCHILGSLGLFTLLLFPHLVQIFSELQICTSAWDSGHGFGCFPSASFLIPNFVINSLSDSSCPDQTCWDSCLSLPFHTAWTPWGTMGSATLQNLASFELCDPVRQVALCVYQASVSTWPSSEPLHRPAPLACFCSREESLGAGDTKFWHSCKIQCLATAFVLARNEWAEQLGNLWTF